MHGLVLDIEESPCVDSDSLGGSHMEEKRIADFLPGCKAGAMENKKRRKTWDICLSLPHSSASAADSLSPRVLLSRLRLSLHKASPARGGGAGDGIGCRMRFPRHRSFKKEKDEERGEVECEENEAEVGGGKVVDSPVSAPPASGGRASPLPDSAIVDGGREGSGETGRKPEEVSLNLGMGIGLVFLLARSATEFDKMVELRAQMETLLKDIKDEIQRKEVPPNNTESNNIIGSSASNSFGNGNTSNSISLRNDRASYHLPRLHSAMESAAQSKCDTAPGSKRCLKVDQIEAELEIELERLRLDLGDKDSSAYLQPHGMELTSGNTDPSENLTQSSEEGNEAEERSFHYGVNPRELERRLHELLETRQQERIAELESALEYAERMLHERDREICWWRDTAKLVSHHKDETLFR
ncbi:protein POLARALIZATION DURING ASYMMETRIC DIVISION AND REDISTRIBUTION-like isoform X2 [Elaeis guineensis]|uniref:Protein POLAR LOCALIZATION DURING ASYMMETRIC DIVISION AND REDISTRIBUTION isoform X1 n=1 Tax=Elaeis guineensis var. tenera TaxID=51953 RepID=A0A6J0PSW1_ELAGV|nr:protein POLAR LOCALIZATION DURING ASYMMETRIC DIVISION AND REDISTRIBUTION isoform X1 [Elaeis guineensis]XP_029116313.1 protein POLAR LOCALIZATION DURING ASYMMETRIC DIVISION AND REDISTRIBUTION isoform X2 [Elaeis guineensis]